MNGKTSITIHISKDELMSMIRNKFILDDSFSIRGINVSEGQRDELEGIIVFMDGTLQEKFNDKNWQGAS